MKSAAIFVQKNLQRLGACLVILSAIAFSTFRPALDMRPFDPDNLIALSLAVRSNPMPLIFNTVTTYMPAYRPVPYLSIWLEYRLLGLAPQSFFLSSQIIWVACGMLVFLLTYRYTRSKLISTLVAVLFLLELRATTIIIWVSERQNSLAIFFGLLAMLLTIMPSSPRANRWRGPGIFASLLLAALSKEYGLAFAGATLILIWLEHPKERIKLSALVFLSAGIYFLMRITLAGGAINSYCEDMGYFFSNTNICYGDLEPLDRGKQQLFNIAITWIGTLFPSQFDYNGRIYAFYNPETTWQLLVVVPALVAWRKHFRETLPWLALFLFNGILSFMLYRTRNQLVGLAGLYISFGVGLNFLIRELRRNRQFFDWIAPVVLTILLGCFTFLLTNRVTQLNYQLTLYQKESTKIEPCVSYQRYAQDIHIGIVSRIKTQYKLPDPQCNNSYPK